MPGRQPHRGRVYFVWARCGDAQRPRRFQPAGVEVGSEDRHAVRLQETRRDLADQPQPDYQDARSERRASQPYPFERNRADRRVCGLVEAHTIQA